MIHLFNRVELLVTYNLNRFNQVCDLLAAAGIDYTYRTKDFASSTLFSSRGHAGTFGMNHDARIEYKVYVQQADIGRAKALL